MPLKNNRAPLLCCFKLCASFPSHQGIQTRVTVQKHPTLGQNPCFFVQCVPAIWAMTLKNSRAPLLCYFKLWASFCNNWWFQTVVTVWKRPICLKIDDFFLAVWPWHLMDDIEKQLGTSPTQHQAMCIISSSYHNWNWSCSPETA